MAAKTKLAFEAKIAGVKIEPAKDNYGSTGKLLVTLVVDQPKPPAKPNVPYNLQGRWTNGVTTIKARPGDNVPHQKKETPEDYDKRVLERRREQQDYDGAIDEYQVELEKHRRRLAAFGPRLMSYAQLIGIAGVFGGQPVSVVITPNQDLLPAFALSLVSEDEAVAGAVATPVALIDATPSAAEPRVRATELMGFDGPQLKACGHLDRELCDCDQTAESPADEPEVEPDVAVVAIPKHGRRSKAAGIIRETGTDEIDLPAGSTGPFE